jgi:tetratricopeptide (TPR) repeat protein
MILLFIFMNLELEAKIDSLEAFLQQNVQLPTVLELNKYYLRTGKINEGNALLQKYERYFAPDDRAIIHFAFADNHLYRGKILEARDEYLKLVSRYPRSDIANDALERLYLIEATRQDTTLLKRLGNTLYLYYTNQLSAAEDSLKSLLRTKIGAYAYYYLALVYREKDDIPLVLSTLKELNTTFPEHNLHNATLFLAEVHLQTDNKKEAQNILEDLIVKEPTSIYGVRAREMLRQHF